MAIKEDIDNFPDQFGFSPEIKNEEKWGSFKKYVLLGMGGSHLQGDVLKAVFPDFPLYLHRDYGLPEVDFSGTGIIAASYSGNTEEVLDSFNLAFEKNIPLSVITKGGRLLEMAKKRQVPYIELPQNGIQPRVALGYSFKALLKMIRVEGQEGETEMLADSLKERQIEIKEESKKISLEMREVVPVVYASSRNSVVASVWKINFNETSKIPAFYNLIPELNHNEMTGFDKTLATESLSEKMKFIFLVDKEDDSRNQKRMKALKKILEERGFGIIEIEIRGSSRMEKVFSSVLLSAWTSYYLAEVYNTDPNGVPMVEEFKRMI